MAMSRVACIDKNAVADPARLSLPSNVPLHEGIDIGKRHQMNMSQLVRADIPAILAKQIIGVLASQTLRLPVVKLPGEV